MRIESLKLFCDVVRLRSFSQAARLNSLSQSAASQAMLQLERKLGISLIDRSTRPLQTTELGKIYYRGCKKMLGEYTELEASIRQEGERMEVTVQVAAIYSVGLRDMSQYVDSIRRSYRNAEVSHRLSAPGSGLSEGCGGDGGSGAGFVSQEHPGAHHTSLEGRAHGAGLSSRTPAGQPHQR